MKFDDCPYYLQEYLNYISTIKMRSELTVKNYYTDIKLFLRFLKQENGLCKDTEFKDIKIADTPEDLVKKVTLNDLSALADRNGRSIFSLSDLNNSIYFSALSWLPFTDNPIFLLNSLCRILNLLYRK